MALFNYSTMPTLRLDAGQFFIADPNRIWEVVQLRAEQPSADCQQESSVWWSFVSGVVLP